MDVLRHADEVLARARARHAGIVTPDLVTSPMDLTSTVQFLRALVTEADLRAAKPDSTIAIPNAVFGRLAPAHRDLGPGRSPR